ncbi:putative sodium-coupled neutral amino acid transporter 11 [Lineus longissimus]|uniref:putative sodium-coupled neutral amino acid transporter 11 n=1 Tax=Lineus longissimus TaxID=88925 RepID=UPI002B4F2C9E
MFGRKKETDLALSEDKSLIADTPGKYYSKENETTVDGSDSGNYQTKLVDEKDETVLYDSTQNENKAKSGTFAACFNTANSIIGSGMIGTPYAILKCGVGLGAILLFGVGILTDYSLKILIRSGIYSDEVTYQGVMRKAFGLVGYIVITFMQFMYPFLAMVSYNIIIGDNITKVISRFGGEAVIGSVIADRRFVIFLANVVITVPLSMYKNVAKFAKFAGLSIVMIMFVVFVVIFRMVDFTLENKIPSTPNDWMFANKDFVRGVSIMAFAYLCHHNSFLIYDSLKDKSERGWGKVVHTSVSFVVVVMMVFSLCGYAAFKSFTQGDILENFCSKDDLANAARIIYSINIMLTYPIECFVVRDVIENSVFINRQPQPLWRHIIVTLVICVTTLAISLITDCVSIVLEITGATMASPMIFIFPALCLMKLRPASEKTWQSMIIPIFMVVLGICFVFIGLAQVIMQIIEGIKCSHGKDLAYCFEPIANKTNITWYFYPNQTNYMYNKTAAS